LRRLRVLEVDQDLGAALDQDAYARARQGCTAETIALTFQLRGVPARLYDDGSLELSTADVTVVIFGRDRRQLVAAAEALWTPAEAPMDVGVREELPPPVPGAQNGTLGC
jgi:hypothetical protein